MDPRSRPASGFYTMLQPGVDYRLTHRRVQVGVTGLGAWILSDIHEVKSISHNLGAGFSAQRAENDDSSESDGRLLAFVSVRAVSDRLRGRARRHHAGRAELRGERLGIVFLWHDCDALLRFESPDDGVVRWELSLHELHSRDPRSAGSASRGSTDSSRISARVISRCDSRITTRQEISVTAVGRHQREPT